LLPSRYRLATLVLDATGMRVATTATRIVVCLSR
jgi:hypothetical protein